MDNLRIKARKKVKQKKKFHQELIIFIFTSLFFLYLNFGQSGGSFPWSLFILIPWGIPIIRRGLKAYGVIKSEEESIQKEMEKLKEKKSRTPQLEKRSSTDQLDLDSYEEPTKQVEKKNSEWNDEDLV